MNEINKQDVDTDTLKWSKIDEYEEIIQLADLPLHLSGVAVSHSQTGDIITGSAASLIAPPKLRSRFELLERLAMIEDSYKECSHKETNTENYRYSLSNGVALDSNVDRAKNKAYLELVERDSVLRSWWGQTKPEKLKIKESYLLSKEMEKSLLKLSPEYEVEAYSFGPSENGIYVMGVFILPSSQKNKDFAPIVYGFSARNSKKQVFEHALGEALQRLGFLKDEKIKKFSDFKNEVPFSPSPLYHQEYFLTDLGNEQILKWLSGEYFNSFLNRNDFILSQEDKSSWQTLAPHIDLLSVASQFGFDLPYDDREGGFKVVRAKSSKLIPLVFGKSYEHVEPFCSNISPNCIEERMIHPIV